MQDDQNPNHDYTRNLDAILRELRDARQNIVTPESVRGQAEKIADIRDSVGKTNTEVAVLKQVVGQLGQSVDKLSDKIDEQTDTFYRLTNTHELKLQSHGEKIVEIDGLKKTALVAIGTATTAVLGFLGSIVWTIFSKKLGI